MTTIKNMAYWRSKNNVKSDGSYDGGELKANRSPMKQNNLKKIDHLEKKIDTKRDHFEELEKERAIMPTKIHKLPNTRIVDNTQTIPEPQIQLMELPRMKKIDRSGQIRRLK